MPVYIKADSLYIFQVYLEISSRIKKEEMNHGVTLALVCPVAGKQHPISPKTK